MSHRTRSSTHRDGHDELVERRRVFVRVGTNCTFLGPRPVDDPTFATYTYPSQRFDEVAQDLVESIGLFDGDAVPALLEEFEARVRNEFRHVLD